MKRPTFEAVAQLMNGSPGTRFVEHYERRHRQRAGKLSGTLPVVGGAFLVVLGLALVVTPGPGLALLLVGAATLATRSLALAHVLDRCEIYLRVSARRLRKSRR